MPSQADLENLPEDERLMKAAQAAKAAASAQGIAETLREKAAAITDPKERERILREAYDREVEAYGNTKKARILKSGTFQGAIGGAGIGSMVGVGLGTVVGTVVGGVASIPTTALGGLVGSGVGAIHGPFIKMGGGKKKKEEDEVVQVPKEAIESGGVMVDENTGQVTAENPDALRKAAAKAERDAAKSGSQAPSDVKARNKPKKLEVRSNKTMQAPAKSGAPASSEGTVKKKPKKLEVRSNKTKQAP